MKFCGECGARLNNQSKFICPVCGYENEQGVKFCGECGTRMEVSKQEVSVEELAQDDSYVHGDENIDIESQTDADSIEEDHSVECEVSKEKNVEEGGEESEVESDDSDNI